MSAAQPKARERLRFPGVRAPRPMLPPKVEAQLTGRQREVLDELEALLVDEELAELTMAQLAARLNCSLRTLYGISPSKDELVLTVADRRLHRIGRAAIGSLDASLPPLEAVRVYLRAATEAVQPSLGGFAASITGVPGGKHLVDSHEAYLVAVVRELLDRAVADASIAPVDTAAVAHVLGGLGQSFSHPGLNRGSARSAKASADAVTDIILRGLEAS
ncbi:MAG: hypothetical protein AAEJ53_20295 [Myxococcota bacterium]